MIKALLVRPGVIFGLIFAWKVGLLLLTVQPVPSNDAFFYDGPVVNFLLGGKYCNPSLSFALPISGNEVFCAYPPLYQLLLVGWMKILGTSVIAAMILHLVLFGVYMLLLLALCRRLRFPTVASSLGAAFLLVITFHDRPDSLAHVFGIAALYAWVRWQSAALDASGARRLTGWAWAMAAFAVLGLCTGLQIGAVYFLLIWTAVLGGVLFARTRLPAAPMLASIVVPLLLILLVVFGYPHLWAGFLEHARQTPSLTGWRWPLFHEVLKMVRTVPGVLLVAILMPWLKANRASDPVERLVWLATLASTIAALAITGAAMFLLTPNSVLFAAYLQPVVVGGYLTLALKRLAPSQFRLQTYLFIAAACLGAVRAVGMSTWGVACARDVSQLKALARVRQEFETGQAGEMVVSSAAYLYEAARHRQVRPVHCDWLAAARRGEANTDKSALIELKPPKLVLTQFDFYRRYQPVLVELQSRPDLVQMDIINTATVAPPDSQKRWQKVVQHISWAPVIVHLSWK